MLPDSTAHSMLEDLVAADRYRLLGMKRICQSMLRLCDENCLQVSSVVVSMILSACISCQDAGLVTAIRKQQKGRKNGTPKIFAVPIILYTLLILWVLRAFLLYWWTDDGHNSGNDCVGDVAVHPFAHTDSMRLR